MVVTSCKCGKFSNRTFPGTISAAARIGKAAFFAPLTLTSPLKRRPPRIKKRSILNTQSLSLIFFARCQRGDGDRMQSSFGDFVGNQSIHGLLPFHPTHGLKVITDRFDLKVAALTLHRERPSRVFGFQ